MPARYSSDVGPAISGPGSRRQLVGEPVQGVDDLEELAERAAGVEVVVHRVEEPLAVLGDFLQECRVPGIEFAAADAGARADRTLAGQLREPLERPVERLQPPLDLVEPVGPKSIGRR